MSRLTNHFMYNHWYCMQTKVASITNWKFTFNLRLLFNILSLRISRLMKDFVFQFLDWAKRERTIHVEAFDEKRLALLEIKYLYCSLSSVTIFLSFIDDNDTARIFLDFLSLLFKHSSSRLVPSSRAFHNLRTYFAKFKVIYFFLTLVIRLRYLSRFYF